MSEPLVIEVHNCEDCPFEYDCFTCTHPDGEEVDVWAWSGLPTVCPIRARPVLVKLAHPVHDGPA